MPADEEGGGGGLPHLADRLNVLFARVPQAGTNQRLLHALRD